MWGCRQSFFPQGLQDAKVRPSVRTFRTYTYRQGVVWTGIPDGRAFPFPNGLPFPALSAGVDTHRPQTPFHPAVILLNDIVEILARANRDGAQLSILGPKLANGAMGGLVSVESDRARHTSLCLNLKALPKKALAAATSRLGLRRKSTV